MFQKKRYLYLSEAEYSILVKSLIQLKNKLIQQNRFTDCVDELLFKIVSARKSYFDYSSKTDEFNAFYNRA